MIFLSNDEMFTYIVQIYAMDTKYLHINLGSGTRAR